MHVPATTVHFFDRATKYYDDVVGVITDEGTKYTYGEFADRVHRLSHALQDLGVTKGDRVAVISPNTHWCLETLFAVHQLGAIFVPLNYRLIESDYEYLLSDSGAHVVLADYEYADKIEAIREDVPAHHFVGYRSDRIDGDWTAYEDLLGEYPAEQPVRPDIGETDEASINYTSGTTGDPKGVVRTHRTDVWNAVIHSLNMELKDDDTYLWTLPMFHVNGWGNMYTITGIGGTHVCLRSFEPGKALSRIQEHDVSYLSGAPTVLNRLLEYHEDNPAAATSGTAAVRISTAGAAPPRATIEAVEDDLGWELYHFFGHTESGPYTTSYSPRRITEHGRVQIKRQQGIPSLTNELRVVDEAGEDVPQDDETMGEVVLRGNLVMDRYWQKPGETDKAFNDRVEGWFHSGDLATIDANGMISICDRKKDIIVSGGENISSIEIEDVFYDHPDVVKAAVIPIPSEDWGETPKALLITRPDADLTPETAREFAQERLASFKVPREIELVDELPETATGKVQKYELRQEHWKDEDRMVGEG